MTLQNNAWIWQQPGWPNFYWQDEVIQPRLHETWRSLGILLGRVGSLHDRNDPALTLDTLLQNIVTSSAIEGERLNVASVRSSLARRLGVDNDAGAISARSEGLAEMLLDAIGQPDYALNREQLFQWYHWLFPDTGAGTMLGPLRVGQWRGNEPMQVVSGRIDNPRIHFEAPPRDVLDAEMSAFLEWFDASRHDPALDPILRAGIAHFRFVTVHPFEDGNGRLARAIADRALAQADHQSIRLYAMSAAILARRQDYYLTLEASQRGTLDLSDWLAWFLDTLISTLQEALAGIDRTLVKARFWQRYNNQGLAIAQIKVLNRLLDGGERGFENGISAAQYQKVAKVSKATATRHLADLLEKGCIEKLPGGGRSTRYRIATS
ncbi:Fic family protein [Phytohalomonas tamaricis]|uniref:Fic family protein n=1 Tax=Phytohalomonas tamaricis TaxID=2081032 RepID=UPI000D0B7F55|nr:Fic family protein [Phytohalomonas tamaricis]